MSTLNPQSGIPVIIKGGRSSGILPKPIEIHADDTFQVTEEFQSQPTQWIQSDSAFSVTYVESLTIGPAGEDQQFCQTSSMSHPLTYFFKDHKDNNVFTLSEVANGGNYSLLVSVDKTDNCFEITQPPNWTVSIFDTTETEVFAVEVVDSNSVTVCRLLRTNEYDIQLNLA
jgi:hypothetical protein